MVGVLEDGEKKVENNTIFAVVKCKTRFSDCSVEIWSSNCQGFGKTKVILVKSYDIPL